MFIRDIAVAGYQSLYKVGLKLGQFTVIYGESDVGKSAFYRAVRALIISESGDDFISKGKGKVGVALRLVSGEKIVWVKKRGQSGEYRLDDKVWRRNRALPEELSGILKLTQLTVNGDKFFPNLRGQFDSLFLLFESSPKRARVLGALISNLLLQGIRQANVERNRNEADVRAMSGLVDALERKEQFDWNKFTANMRGTLKVLKLTLTGVETYNRLRGLRDRWEGLVPLTKFSVDFLPQKFFSENEKLLKAYSSLKNYREAYQGCVAQIESLSGDEAWCTGEMKRLKSDMTELKKKLMIRCPHCKKQFSVLEVKQ